jgi:Flp pilus assembly protein TadD
MRKTTIIIFSFIVLLLAGYVGYRGYKVWKQDHWLKMARNFAAKDDSRDEVLCLRQALTLNPQNVAACRLMANLADATRSDSALMWRQRVVDLDSKSLQSRLALMQTALNTGNFIVASNALTEVEAADQKTAVFQNAAGLLASGQGHEAEAKTYFLEAIKLEPANVVPQLNLAALLLHSQSLTEAEAGRISLRQISQTASNATLRNQAKRELITDALRLNEFTTAADIAKNLASSAEATFSDRLLRVEVLEKANSTEFAPVLAACEHEAAGDSAKLAGMAVWLIQNRSAAQAFAWLQTLPLTTQTNQPAMQLMAESLLHAGEWHRLQENIQKQNWGESEFIRHAFLARALRGQDLKDAGRAEWSVALNQASERKGALLTLFRMAAAWQWHSEGDELLWLVVNRFPEEHWAAPVLMQSLINNGRTRPLMQLFSLLLRRNPGDVELKNNVASTALLLGAQEVRPDELAQSAYEKSPKNPAFATTYAYALYRQKQFGEALQVIQSLPETVLTTPAVAGYYGLVLQATGNTEKAKRYLKLALSSKLLPEEQALFQRALVN